MPMFFGYSVKHLVLSVGTGFLDSLAVCSFSLLAAFAGLFYSHKILYFTFFDSKKARKSAYLGNSYEGLRSDYYSNTTLASNISIVGLVLAAFLACFMCSAYLVGGLPMSLSDGASSFGLELAPLSAIVDHGLHFNFKLLNTVVFMFFLFISFFSWSRSASLGYSRACSLALALTLA